MAYPSEIPVPSDPSHVVREHIQKQTITEYVDYPTHGVRNVEAFNKLTQERIVKNNQPCFICGVTARDIETKPELKAHGCIELHHCLAQFALENGVDLDKWNNVIIPLFNQGVIWNPNKITLKSPMTAQEVVDFVNFGNANMLPLCTLHHVGRFTGIHRLTYPIWIAQKFLQQKYLPQNQQIVKNLLAKKQSSQ